MSFHRQARKPLLAAGVLGLLMIGVSLAPWFQHEYAYSDARTTGVRTASANAWAASWSWGCACTLGLLAGLLGLRLWASTRQGWFVAAVGLLSMAAVAAVLIDYLPLLRPPDVGGEGFFTSSELVQGRSAEDPMAVHRGMLMVVKVNGYESRVGWGLYTGLGLLIAQVLAFAAAGAQTLRSPSTSRQRRCPL